MDNTIAFGTYNFVEFRQLYKWHHEKIQIIWNIDVNKSNEILTFAVGNKWVLTRHKNIIMTKER